MSSRDRDSHRTRLLEAAGRLLRERDYGSITARDLVAVSDTNLGSIGYHFGSKEALLNEAIAQAFDEWAETIGRAIDADASHGLLVWMMRSLAVVLDEYDAIRPYHRAFVEALARSAHAPELRRQLAAHYERQRERIAAWIVEAVGGALEPRDARHIASLMLGTADGMLVQSFIDPQQVPSSRELAAATASALGATGGRLAPAPQA
jgi:AcrR family transcriptional regulator